VHEEINCEDSLRCCESVRRKNSKHTKNIAEDAIL
jgi:hypothetical protein